MSTKIKDVEGIEITLSESTVTEEKPASLVVLFMVFFGAFFGVMYLGLQPPDRVSTMILIMLSILAATFGTLLASSRISSESPAYCITGRGLSEVSIKKTTLEADQLAICKAVQELEVKVHEIAKKQKELETIAARCK